MKSADGFDRAYFVLGGLPNLQELGKLLIGESTEENHCLRSEKEYEKHDALVAAIALAEDATRLRQP